MIATELLMKCRSPYCDEPPAIGRRFCSYHAEVLDRVKDSIEGRSAEVRNRIGRKSARPTCCRSGCWEPRMSYERYCAACRAEGWNEEDDL